jgi:carbohydrate kinase (thermoresistant glucokinase family)
MIIILMGVLGSGKTTIGRKLAGALGCPFYDADDFHPQANREKMGLGVPLTDEDRKPWLEILADEMKKWTVETSWTVLACSALKQKYRDILSLAGAVQWVYLKGDLETVQERVGKRLDHFAKTNLLESQFGILEEPADAILVDIRKEPDIIVDEIVEAVKGKHGFH